MPGAFQVGLHNKAIHVDDTQGSHKADHGAEHRQAKGTLAAPNFQYDNGGQQQAQAKHKDMRLDADLA